MRKHLDIPSKLTVIQAAQILQDHNILTIDDIRNDATAGDTYAVALLRQFEMGAVFRSTLSRYLEY